MSSIAEFISGTVNESLKKLLQPVGLIPASLFVLLNLAFVYPSARSDGVQLATTFSGLDAPTQAAVVALLALALSYFLLSASSTILDVLGGELIRGSVLYALLVLVQRGRRARLAAAGDWYLSRRFYVSPEGEDDLPPLPSSLGNVLRATQGSVAQRYGIDIAALWSQFVATPELKDLPARAVVEDERASRDILINTALVLWVFALEGLVYFTAQDHPRDVLLSLVAVPAGYLAYRVSVKKAEAWGDAVETLVDLHRDKLHAALKLAPYTSLSTERRVWQRATRFYLGADEGTADDVFERQGRPSVTAIPSGEVAAATPVAAVREGPETVAGKVWLRWIDYVVLVARTGQAAVSGAEVLVNDPRVARIAGAPVLLYVPPVAAQVEVVAADAGRDALLWRIGPLGAGTAISLRYRLPLAVIDGVGGAVPSRYAGVGFAFPPPRAFTDLEIAYSEAGPGRPRVLLDDTALLPAGVDAGTYAWTGVATAYAQLWVVLPEGTAS
jgi:hypothetical protein